MMSHKGKVPLPVYVAAANTSEGHSRYAFAGELVGVACHATTSAGAGHSVTAVSSLTALDDALGLLALLFTSASVGIDCERNQACV